MRSKNLGRGLSALMGENLIIDSSDSDGLSYLSLDNVFPNPEQPRKIFNSAELEELSNSIKQNGILQPIIVKPLSKDRYQIIAGERRWRAAKSLGLVSIPAVIKDVSEKKSLEVALIENVQRENLTSLEEAECYKNLIDQYQYTQEKIAEVVSKSRSHIANILRLINLPDKVKEYLNQNLISLGHAKLLINQENAEELVEIIVSDNLNVRDSEDLIRKKKHNNLSKKSLNSNKIVELEKNEDLIALGEYLSESLGMLVKVENVAKGGNEVVIHCENMDQLDIVIQKLSGSIT